MTETHPVSESYESLRDSVENVEARAAWNDADRRTALLTDTYRNLRDDPRFTEAHRSEQMWEAYAKQSTHIQAAGEKAREELEKDARGHEMMSIPRPKGENIFNLSTERLIAAQNEAARIARKTQRLQDERLIFSVLVWPPLERGPHRAGYDHRERVGAILEAIAQGSADKAWSVRWEIDGGLRWDDERQVWVGEDGFAYDGSRFFDYSRTGAVWGEGA
jgi:hypothetical protein